MDAAAFINFVGQFDAATNRGRCLFEGGVYYFAMYTASSPSNYVDKQMRSMALTKFGRETHKTSTDMGKIRQVPSAIHSWNTERFD